MQGQDRGQANRIFFDIVQLGREGQIAFPIIVEINSDIYRFDKNGIEVLAAEDQFEQGLKALTTATL